MDKLLFNFNNSYIYSFLAGIFVSISANLFTTVYTTSSNDKETIRLCILSLFFLLMSISCFSLSFLLNRARTKWIEDGAQQEPKIINRYIEIKMPWISFFFIGLIVLIFFSIIISIDFLYEYIEMNIIKIFSTGEKICLLK